MSYLVSLHEEVRFREQEAYEILSWLFSDGQIRELCRRADELLRSDGVKPFAAMTPEQFSDFVKQTFAGITLDYRDAICQLDEHEFYVVTFYAVLAAVYFRDIQKRLLPLLGGDIAVPAEDMARTALGVSIATLCLTEAGWKPSEKIANHGKRFRDGPKGKRLDVLSNAMLASIKAFCDTHGRNPTAQELWNVLPEDTYIQEKEADEDGNQTIYWRSPSGKENATTFKSFQNRYSNLRKKMSL